MVGGKSVKKSSILILIIAVVAVAIPQAVAADKYQIFVHDSNGNNVANAYVEVLDGGNKIGSGYTDSSGVFTSWLETGAKYQITASGNGQSGDWQGYPSGGKIDINMH